MTTKVLWTSEHRKKLEEKFSGAFKRIADSGGKFIADTPNGLSASEQDVVLSSIFNNGLDAYTSTMYNIRLSLVAPEQFKTRIPISHAQRLNTEKAILLASNNPSVAPIWTHDGTDAPIEAQTTMLIQDVTIEQHMSYDTRNSGAPEEQVANMLGINMQLLEPHGLGFDRMLRSAAKLLGYKDGTTPASFVWRVDVWFSGYNGLDYVEHIPMLNPLTKNIVEHVSVHSYYTKIVEMPVEVTMTSSRYTAKMVPVAQTFFTLKDVDRDVDPIEEGQVFNLGDLLAKYEERLNDPERKSKDAPAFKFHIPSELRSQPVGKSTGVGTDTTQYKVESNILSTVSMWLRLTDMVRKGLQQGFPRLLYDMAFEADYSTAEFDEKLNDYIGVLVHVFIVPLRDYRFAPITPAEIASVSKTHQEVVLKDRTLRRVYTYMYGADNTEVESMTINLNTFYYAKLGSADYAFYRSRLTSVPDAQTFEYGIPSAARPDVPTTDIMYRTLYNALNLGSFDAGKRPSVTAPRGAAAWHQILKAFMGAGAVINSDAPEKVGVSDEVVAYGAEFDRLCNVDMIKLDSFVVRGDPNWMFSYNNHYESLDLGATDHDFTYRCPTIFIRVYRPTQEAFMHAKSTTRELDADLSGFYQITKCSHEFVNGKYTNSLEGVRLLIT